MIDVIKRNKLLLKLYVFICLILASTTISCARWTVLIYADSSDNLSDAVIKNITDLTLAQLPADISIAIQLHASGDQAYRYIIKDNALIPLTIVDSADIYQSLVDSAYWAFNEYPSDKTMLILWNHGFGALDPNWDEATQSWQAEPDVYSFLNQLDSDEIEQEIIGSCSIKKSYNHNRHKGYMFNAAHDYLTSDDLKHVLQEITTNLNGRKIDIICFDTCMGAMVETAYQCSPFAQYLVGVQSCASRDGFNYKAFGNVFDVKNDTSSEVTKAMVQTFDEYYKDIDQDGIYTLSAIELSKVETIKNLIDASAQQLEQCLKLYDHKQLRAALRKAHANCVTLCLFPMYTDLYTLLTLFHENLKLLEPSGILTELINTLSLLSNAVKNSIVAHCCGQSLLGKVHGISIYFPYYHIDSSYATTIFGGNSEWSTFLALATAECMG